MRRQGRETARPDPSNRRLLEENVRAKGVEHHGGPDGSGRLDDHVALLALQHRIISVLHDTWASHREVEVTRLDTFMEQQGGERSHQDGCIGGRSSTEGVAAVLDISCGHRSSNSPHGCSGTLATIPWCSE